MIQFEKELITPSKAKTYLEANTNNRNIKDRHVLKLSNEMKSGRWKQDTAETIKISKTGRILDGQHRLMAVIQSGVSTYFHVAKGLNEEVFDVIDTGSNRSAADVFKINHAKYESTLPSIIQTSKIISRGKRDSRQSYDKLTNSELLEIYQSDPIYWNEVARLTVSWYDAFSKILTPSLIGGFYSYLSDINESKAKQFFNELTSGNNISNETINVLRKKLIQDKLSQHKMNKDLKMIFIIKTWNAFITNKNVKLLKFDAENEEYPSISIGLLNN